MEREEQAFILQTMGTAALEQQPTVFSSSALSFDYPFCPPPLLFLPTSNDLCAFQDVWATEGNVHASVYAHVHICNREHMRALIPVHAYTEAWPCVRKLFGFHPCGRVRDHIPSSKHTAAPSNESPLSSASTALGYSSFHALPNGFSNAGTRFLSRLDRHFPLCLEMGIRHWVVC